MCPGSGRDSRRGGHRRRRKASCFVKKLIEERPLGILPTAIGEHPRWAAAQNDLGVLVRGTHRTGEHLQLLDVLGRRADPEPRVAGFVLALPPQLHRPMPTRSRRIQTPATPSILKNR